MAGAIEGAAATVIASARQPSACEPIEHARDAGATASSRTSSRIRAALRRYDIPNFPSPIIDGIPSLPGDYPVKQLATSIFLTFRLRCGDAVRTTSNMRNSIVFGELVYQVLVEMFVPLTN
jgi:hypothetical protein